MNEFFHALGHYAFLQNALLMGLLSSIACGVVGTFVVVRRIGYIAGGVSHCVLGGMGAAWWLQVACGWRWMHPLYGALAAALAAALVIGTVTLRARQREDTVIGALWAIGMAIGVLFIQKTPGWNVDLMSYLFGNITLVRPEDLWLVAGLDALIIVLVVLYYNKLLAVCFDAEFARLRGVRVEGLYLLLLCLTAVTVVLLSVAVGIILVIALLTLPAALAGNFVTRLWQMMALAVVLSMIFTSAGLAVSYGPDLPAGATTIVIAGAAYLLGAGFKTLRRPA